MIEEEGMNNNTCVVHLLASFPGSLPLRIYSRVYNIPAYDLWLAVSKVTGWNYCTRVNIRKGREPGNEATSLTLTVIYGTSCV